MQTYLIADSGSTKTDWVITREGVQLAAFQSAGINPFYQTAEQIIPVLNEQVIPNFTAQVDRIFFYGAGCADEKTSRPVLDALSHCIPAAAQIEIASDMLGAARGLCGREPGLACILGTGANNAFYDGEKIVHSIGSLGFWLGDEGSGSYLGKTLVVQFLQNELPAALHEDFAVTYPEINRLYVLDNAYKKPYPNRFFAGFSQFISAHIADSHMQHLVNEAFSLFTEKYILKHPNAADYPVHFTGSVAFYYQAILQEVLASKGLQCGRILRTPLDGLVLYYS
ncbi:N-acetylglucosamine kinase [Dyadobacter crusticola]|uniref:N-acetylglucosamine kinase n=1 Tax=Dyadobacter crusticola TaxID=292407 RepID=UPI0004E1C542|nr:N-acetylglucosamine kinase [Dyadobacter crusticola]